MRQKKVKCLKVHFQTKILHNMCKQKEQDKLDFKITTRYNLYLHAVELP